MTKRQLEDRVSELERRVMLTRRQFAKRGMLTIAAGLVAGPAFTAPSCGPAKEKAVRVAGFVIDLSKEAVPLLDLLSAHDIAVTLSDKVIPALEKLKDALASADIPASQSTLATVRSVLSGVATGLLNLPDSPRRTTIIGILASVNVLLLTVEAFVESEESPARAAKTGAARAASVKQPSTGATILKVFEASRL